MTFAAFCADLAGRNVGENVLALASVDSTNRLARALVERLGPECPPTTIVAWRQLAGRGRLGRSWASPAGRGVYASLTRVLPREGLLALPLLAGAGVATAVARATGLDCRLKWPNDVVVGGRKLGGVLIEAVVRGGASMAGTVIGLGVNVGHRKEDLPHGGATSLWLESGARPGLAALLAEIVAAVDGELRRCTDEGYAVERFSRLMIHRLGDRLTCRLPGEEVTGELLGFDRRGLVRLRVAGQERRLAAAELEA